MRQGWGDRELDLPRHSVADFSARRRAALADAFPGERLVVPAGQFKVRANDTDYRFRADSAHVHLTGNQTSDAVLVIEDGESVLYARPRSSRQTDEFFRDRRYGELLGRPPPVAEGDLRLPRPRGAPPRRARRAARGLGQDPGAARRRRVRRQDGARRRRSRPRLRPGALGDAAGQGRLGARAAAGGVRHHHARVRRQRPGVGQRAEVRRALARGHVLPAGPDDGQRPRLRLDRGRRLARHHAALDRELRPDHPRPARCCWTWAWRATTSTRPT